MKHLRADIILLPNGLEIGRYQFQERHPPLRKLIWIRAFHAIYNPVMAVEVLSGIAKQHGDVRLTMVGPDKGDGTFQEAQQATARLKLKSAIEFAGALPKSEIPSRLAQSDVFLNTTNFDNTPVSVLEALATGLPVVSTNVGGIPYLLKDGQTALLTDKGNAEGMTRAILRLMQDPGLVGYLARNGKQLIRDFDWVKVLPKWDSLLRRLVQPHSDLPRERMCSNRQGVLTTTD
jgi:glycosyltransferase involved in cell wall biosynthesis